MILYRLNRKYFTKFIFNLFIFTIGLNNSILSQDTLRVPLKFNSIQSALNESKNGGIILVEPGTYKENIVWPDKFGIKLISNGDTSNTIISGESKSSVLYINDNNSKIDSNTLIKGFKFTNGGGVANGGGIFIKNASPKLINILITKNTSTSNGGGIFFHNSKAMVDQITISNNLSNVGGAVYQESSNIVATNLIINNNNASSDGGGIYSIYSYSIFKNISITNNGAKNRGGGIREHYSTNKYESFIISKNSGGGWGGGVYTFSSNCNFKNGVIKNNSATLGGGAAFIHPSLNKMDSTDFISNSAMEGGGLYVYQCGIDFSNGKIINNSASSIGGGIWFYDDQIRSTVKNFTFYKNISKEGAAVSLKTHGVDFLNGDFVQNRSTTDLGIISITNFYLTPKFLNCNFFKNQSNNTFQFKKISDCQINKSNFIDNKYAIRNLDNSTIINAQSNFWGDASGPYNTNNQLGKGDTVSSFVKFTNWSDKINTDSINILPPMLLDTSKVNGSSVTLKWNKSLSQNIIKYKIYYTNDSTDFKFINYININSDTSYKFTNLDCTKDYYFYTTAIDNLGRESSLSNGVIFKKINIPSPSVKDTVFCQNQSNIRLSAISSNSFKLKWYLTNDVLAIGDTNAIQPITKDSGNYIYYVSQISLNDGCESQKIPMLVKINPSPISPIVKDTTFCQNANNVSLTANVSNNNVLIWYGMNSIGGISSTTPPLPSTSSVGSFEYYVSQKNTLTGCESFRSKLKVIIKITPSSPIITRDTANNLVASVNGISWYKDGTVLSDTTQKFKPNTPGSYAAKTTQNGCISTMSSPYYYLVTNVINFNNDEFIKLAPNPFFNQINLDFNVKGYQKLNVDVFELTTGNRVFSRQGLNAGMPISLGKLSPGTYIINITSNDNKIVQQFKILKL